MPFELTDYDSLWNNCNYITCKEDEPLYFGSSINFTDNAIELTFNADCTIKENLKRYIESVHGFCSFKKVIFNDPATIVFWSDGTKTVVKCREGETFDKWTGLAMAIAKRVYGSRFHHIFREFCEVKGEEE